MRGRARRFVKTTVLGGIVFLVPLAVLVLLAVKAAGLLRRLAQPVARVLPVKSALGFLTADVVVIALLLLTCFLAGLLAHLSVARRLITKAEAGVLWHVPGYGLVKALTDSVDTGTTDGGSLRATMRPILAHFDDYTQLAFEVDRLDDGRRIVYLPSAPEPRAGTVLVLDAARVEPLPLSFLAAMDGLRKLGHGLGPALRRP